MYNQASVGVHMLKRLQMKWKSNDLVMIAIGDTGVAIIDSHSMVKSLSEY